LLEIGSAVIAVRPLTRLTLTEISASQGTETLNVGFQAGRIRVDVNPPAGTKAAMTVTSPSATASVRGTGYDFNGRTLHVYHGTVSFQGNKGYAKDVGAGSTSSIGNYGTAGKPQNQNHSGYTPQKPVGTDSSSGSTGGGSTGTGGTEEKPGPKPNPTPTPTPTPTPKPPPDGSVDIDIKY
jgi:hypothetical protein